MMRSVGGGGASVAKHSTLSLDLALLQFAFTEFPIAMRAAASAKENNPRQTSAFLKLPPSLVADYPLVLAEIRGGCLFCIAPHSLADSTSYLGWANIPNGPARSRLLLHPVPSAQGKNCLAYSWAQAICICRAKKYKRPSHYHSFPHNSFSSLFLIFLPDFWPNRRTFVQE
jgi:hypothetical protein